MFGVWCVHVSYPPFILPELLTISTHLFSPAFLVPSFDSSASYPPPPVTLLCPNCKTLDSCRRTLLTHFNCKQEVAKVDLAGKHGRVTKHCTRPAPPIRIGPTRARTCSVTNAFSDSHLFTLSCPPVTSFRLSSAPYPLTRFTRSRRRRTQQHRRPPHGRALPAPQRDGHGGALAHDRPAGRLPHSRRPGRGGGPGTCLHSFPTTHGTSSPDHTCLLPAPHHGSLVPHTQAEKSCVSEYARFCSHPCSFTLLHTFCSARLPLAFRSPSPIRPVLTPARSSSRSRAWCRRTGSNRARW